MIIFFCIIYSFTFIFSSNSNFIQNYVSPTDYLSISSDYGKRKLDDSTHFHNGIDFLAPTSSKVYATSSGIVLEVDFSNVYGNYIIILHDDGFKSLYGHLSENLTVNVGLSVNYGDIIGYVGPKFLANGRLNGMTTGPHLHFSIFDINGSPIDPKTKITNLRL